MIKNVNCAHFIAPLLECIVVETEKRKSECVRERGRARNVKMVHGMCISIVNFICTFSIQLNIIFSTHYQTKLHTCVYGTISRKIHLNLMLFMYICAVVMISKYTFSCDAFHAFYWNCSKNTHNQNTFFLLFNLCVEKTDFSIAIHRIKRH